MVMMMDREGRKERDTALDDVKGGRQRAESKRRRKVHLSLEVLDLNDEELFLVLSKTRLSASS
jgi:hypothetical protein